MSFLEARAGLFGIRVNQGLSAVGRVEDMPMTGISKEPQTLSHLPPRALISSLLTFMGKDRVEVSLFQKLFYFLKKGKRNRRFSSVYSYRKKEVVCRNWEIKKLTSLGSPGNHWSARERGSGLLRRWKLGPGWSLDRIPASTTSSALGLSHRPPRTLRNYPTQYKSPTCSISSVLSCLPFAGPLNDLSDQDRQFEESQENHP